MKWLVLFLPIARCSAGCVSALDCNAKECLDCSCVNSVCQCGGGWSGPACGTPFCSNRTGCNNHGNCSINAHSINCVCDENWSGEKCTTKACTLKCQHGSMANDDCTACTGCVGGWSGKDCTIWNSQLTAAQLKSAYTTHFDNVKSQISKMVESSQVQSPLPGWLLVASGVDSVSGAPTTPFVDFTFNKAQKWKDGSGKLHGIPDQFNIDAGFTPSEVAEPPVPLRTITDVVSHQVANLKNHKGSVGLLGGLSDPAHIYNISFAHDQLLTVYDSTVSSYTLTVDRNVPLSRFAAAALESLPLEYNPQTKTVFDLFIQTFGNRYPSEATYGGLDETVLGWPSCIQKGSKPSTVEGGHCVITPGNLQAKALAKDYAGFDTTLSSARIGGDPAQKNTTQWVTTVADNPVAVSYKTVSLSDLVPDPLKTVLAKALDDYENKAISSAQATAASLDAKFMGLKRQYSASVQSASCMTAPLGQGVQKFKCKEPDILCDESYSATIKNSGGEIEWSVLNPRAPAGPTVTCGCSSAPAEFAKDSAKENSTAHMLGNTDHCNGGLSSLDNYDVPGNKKLCDHKQTGLATEVDLAAGTAVGPGVGGKTDYQKCCAECKYTRSCVAWHWNMGKCTHMSAIPNKPKQIEPSGFEYGHKSEGKPKFPNVVLCQQCTRPKNINEIAATFRNFLETKFERAYQY